jgi:hypothetical protein
VLLPLAVPGVCELFVLLPFCPFVLPVLTPEEGALEELPEVCPPAVPETVPAVCLPVVPAVCPFVVPAVCPPAVPAVCPFVVPAVCPFAVPEAAPGVWESELPEACPFCIAGGTDPEGTVPAGTAPAGTALDVPLLPDETAGLEAFVLFVLPL